ncbi:MAG: hypothetical protein ACK4MV_05220 [Beijerinckiaceae bacterium]
MTGRARQMAALALLAWVLAGCNGAPVVRGDTEKNFRKSMEEIARRAPPDRMAALDRALRAIVHARAFGSEAERHSHFVSFTDSLSGVRRFSSPLENWSTQRPAIVVARIGRLVDGKTIDEIIELGAREKAAFDERMERWAERQTNAPVVDWSISLSPPRLRLDEANRAALRLLDLSAIAIINTSAGAGDRAMLSFIVENRSTQSIRSIALASRSSFDSGESDPADVFHYVMPTPLAPGARRRIVTRPDITAALSGSVAIVGMESATGQRVGMVPAARPAAKPPLSMSYVAVTETPLTNLRAITR